MFADLTVFISFADKTSLLVEKSLRTVKYHDLYIASSHHLNILLKKVEDDESAETTWWDDWRA